MSEAVHALETVLALPRVGRKAAHRLLDEMPGSGLSLRQVETALGTDPLVLGRAAERAASLLERSKALGIEPLPFWDPSFPERLRRVPDPPVRLFLRGEARALANDLAVALVGTRRPTRFGSRAAHRLGRRVAEADGCVVSGLALGIDTAGHLGCLESGGSTVAVLAHGLDRVYPVDNRDLAERIVAEGGALLSEYPPGEPPRGFQFVERDRLQSGLSDLVVVVETGAAGGAMHTARFARRQDRALASLVHPESTDPDRISGNRELLEAGALALADGQDLQRALGDLKFGASADPPDPLSTRPGSTSPPLPGLQNS